MAWRWFRKSQESNPSGAEVTRLLTPPGYGRRKPAEDAVQMIIGVATTDGSAVS